VLWVGLHLPLLSLESFAATLGRGPAAHADESPDAQTNAQPLALMDAHHIVSADAAAQALGVQAGIKRATALALAPHLLLGQADPWRDAQALNSVAHAALAFTPSVSLSTHECVLLEVQASLRYFGGRAALLRKLRDALSPLGHRIQCVTAPTAQGAALLSRLHNGLHCADGAALQRALDAAPVQVLAAGAEHALLLQGMGLRTLGDLRRMPRAGLARRFGEDLLHELDCALGAQPDPRTPITLPPVFESNLELFARADTTDQLLYGAQMLLARLVAWLSAQHAFVRRFTLLMKHEPRWRRDAHTPSVTTLDIALAEPSRDAHHLLVLLRERLASLQLPAPTLELSLCAEDIARRPPPNAELFPTAQNESEGITRLIERLQARLGRAQVQRMVRVQDHRPECGTVMQVCDPSLHRMGAAPPVRRRADALALPEALPQIAQPVWLLPKPQPLQERDMQPLFEGKLLHLLAGPERIEAGWWDGALAERDYYIAQTGEGALVWLYRARLPVSASGQGREWFLQGRFG
jgi:protein ImuB